jgi:hypothetical protein
MNTTQKNNQSGQGSKVDDRKNKDQNINRNTMSKQAMNDDDFLSGDNAARPYPNQNNPNEGYNKTMAPKQVSNPNIGGNEREYETSTEDEDRYNNGSSEHDDEIMNRRDNEEIDRHDDETRYSKPYNL